MRKAEDLLRAYLVIGEDERERKHRLEQLKALLEQGLETFNLDEFQGQAELDIPTLIASLNTIPLGQGVRLVIVHDADKLSIVCAEAIAEYLKNPNPLSTLCLDCSTLAKRSLLYKAVQAYGAKAIIECAPKKRTELESVVKTIAQNKGLSLDTAAAKELIARAGESTLMLERQLASLKDLLAPQTQITRADIQNNIAQTAEVKPWDLLDAVCARDAARALEVYQSMQNPIHILLLSLIVTRLRELVCARSLSQRGEAGLIADALGKKDWQIRNYRRWALGFAEGELERALSLCVDCERDLKTGANPDTAFIRLVIEMCA